MQSDSGRPRHRSEQRAAHVEVVPHLATPGSHRLVGPLSADTRPVHVPDPYPVPPSADAPVRDHGIGFRSTREVVAEMSPVIYRPGDASDPDRDPERPTRVSIAGPGVPTAASFADDTGAGPATPPPAAPVDDLSDDLDEDPDIADDELLDEAEDALLDELEEGAAFDDADDFDALDDPHFDAPPPATAASPTPQQRRRRRLLGRHHDEPAAADEGSSPEAQPEAPVAPAPEAPPRAGLTPRRRRVRTLHISAPPTGPGRESPPAPEPEVVELGSESDPEVSDPEVSEPEVSDPDVTDPEILRPDVTEPESAESAESDIAQPDDLEQPDDVEQPESSGPRRTTPAISGHVTSTRGRGLSGMGVDVLDADGQVVAHAVTGRRGRYVVHDIAPGTYRLTAGDPVDGDFADAWFGGPGADDAEPLQVADDVLADDVDAALPARVVIVGAVDVLPDRVEVAVSVTDRTSGLPGQGSVVLSTEHFRTELQLDDGRATITLFGTTSDDESDLVRLGKRLRVEYPGTEHTAPQTRNLRLR